MRLPNKSTPYEKSVLHISYLLLDKLVQKPYEVAELYQSLSPLKVSVTDFIESLDVLYCLRKVKMKEGVISYVG